jgi:aspartyl-tRNA(Asn)/glutamyl-tRNA(Gln) amidotransferase subunit C
LASETGAVEVAMAISREQVEHVAHLARLGLSDEETDRLQQQLSQILGHMQMIDQLDTSAIPPTAQVIPVSSVMRDDVSRPSLPTEDILKNAPRREGAFFKVPPVLE